MMVQFVAFDFSYQKSLYEICVSTCDDWGDGHDLFPDKQFNMAGDRSVIAVMWFLYFCVCVVLLIEDISTVSFPPVLSKPCHHPLDLLSLSSLVCNFTYL